MVNARHSGPGTDVGVDTGGSHWRIRYNSPGISFLGYLIVEQQSIVSNISIHYSRPVLTTTLSTAIHLAPPIRTHAKTS